MAENLTKKKMYKKIRALLIQKLFHLIDHGTSKVMIVQVLCSSDVKDQQGCREHGKNLEMSYDGLLEAKAVQDN